MPYAALMIIGGTYFVNGLVVLGKVRPKSAAPFNLFTGLVGTAVPFYILTRELAATHAAYDVVLNIAPMWLFALTFLWVGINAVADNETEGCGWYCIWVAGLAVVFSLVNFLRFHAPREGIIWLNWSYVWALFWVLLATGRAGTKLTRFTGWAAVIQALWSVTLQAILNMLGVWENVATWVFYGATGATILVALALSQNITPPARPASADERIRASVTAS
jgi:hypothetical protein